MGVKRPLGEENLPELSFKQPKQLDDVNQMSMFMTHNLLTAVPRIDSLCDVKSNSYELHLNERLESGETTCASTVGKESERIEDRLETLSESERHKQFDDNNERLEANSDEEDTKDTSFMHSFPQCTDFSIPWRPPQQFEDPYVYLLNSSPRKEVPVGPDYQAELPNLDPSARVQDLSAPNNIWEQSQMGTCIIPMPDSNISNFDESIVGHGRTDCSCPDVGSTRCVQQHVKEVREILRGSIGEETFGELGFYSMGEEVAYNWTANEEQLFHEVVFSNPASHGRDFWEILGFVFPNRKKEIVSYYFNIFMLRRRAVQNRSGLLNIDSDDDENHESADGEHLQSICLHNRDSDDDDNDVNRAHEDFYLVGEEDEESADESIDDRDLYAGWVGGYGPGPENGGVEEGNDDNRATVDVDKRYNSEIGGGKGGSFGEGSKKQA